MTCVIIDYGSGNLRSAAKALERAAVEAGREVTVRVSARAEDLREADHIVLPGVGAFGDCRAGVEALPEMHEALDEEVIARGKPFLGICVGMQLMAERGLEHGVHQGFGWIGGEVVPLAPAEPRLKVPHMGWNELRLEPGVDHPLLAGLPAGAHTYFVHSYHLKTTDPGQVLASVDYGEPVTAMVGRDNLVGTQFHPEKSQRTGLLLLTNFLRWRP
jgi:glutamine amidotransferase